MSTDIDENSTKVWPFMLMQNYSIFENWKQWVANVGLTWFHGHLSHLLFTINVYSKSLKCKILESFSLGSWRFCLSGWQSARYLEWQILEPVWQHTRAKIAPKKESQHKDFQADFERRHSICEQIFGFISRVEKVHVIRCNLATVKEFECWCFKHSSERI